MLSWMNRGLSRVLGGSQGPDQVECYLTDVQNDAAKFLTMDTTVCLTPQIEDGTRLTFQLSPLLKNGNGEGDGDGGGSWNILGHLRNTLKHENGERVVIMCVTRTHVHNEINGQLDFVISHPFDNDTDTQNLRTKIDVAVAFDDKPVAVRSVQKIQRPSHPAFHPQHGNDNNNMIAPSDNESEPGVRALLDSQPLSSRQANEETLRQADTMTIRGSRIYRNKAEINNLIELGSIPANGTSCAELVIYKASVKENIVKWFAGQDRYIVEDPCQVLTRVNTDEADELARADRPVISYLVYPENHSLVMFIDMFADILKRQSHEMRLLRSDREASLSGGMRTTARLYQVDKALVDRAREMILYVVYAQMYYTTLRDCKLIRQVETESDDFALLHRLAHEWGLTVHPQTKHVSDWAPGQYRPQVVVTLRVSYFLIKEVSNSAAALHKERILLSIK